MKKGIIIGGGIGGLTTAIALLQKGIDVTIYEKSPVLKDVGAGIWVAPNGLKVYERLGLAQKIANAGQELLKVHLADIDGTPLSSLDGQNVRKKYGFGTVSIHRAVLQQILLAEIPKENLVLGKAFESFSQYSDKVVAHFEDGENVKAEFMIAAEGIHSKARQQICPTTPRYAGQTCWRFVSEFDFGDGLNDQMFEVWSNKKGLRVGYSRIDDRRAYCFITNYQEAGGKDGEDVQSELLALCEDFQPIVKSLIASSRGVEVLRNDIYDFKPIDRWVDGRVALMGDAAHATTPNMGQGACQAIEDALVLAEELSANEPKQAFLNFQQRRKEKAAFITNNSWRFGKLTNTSGLVKRGIKWLMKMTPASVSEKQLERVYSI